VECSLAGTPCTAVDHRRAAAVEPLCRCTLGGCLREVVAQVRKASVQAAAVAAVTAAGMPMPGHLAALVLRLAPRQLEAETEQDWDH